MSTVVRFSLLAELATSALRSCAGAPHPASTSLKMAALRVACALALCLSASAVDLPNKIDGVKTTYEVRHSPGNSPV